MVKHTQTIRRQIAEELFGVFDSFVKLALKGLGTQSCNLSTPGGTEALRDPHPQP